MRAVSAAQQGIFDATDDPEAGVGVLEEAVAAFNSAVRERTMALEAYVRCLADNILAYL